MLGGFLVIDDDSNFCRLFKKLCVGESVTTTTCLEHGLATAALSRPEYVFLDVRFDALWRTGLDALAELRAATPESKIIVMTSLANAYDRERALAGGAYAYCRKTDLASAGVCAVSVRAIPRAARSRVQAPAPAPRRAHARAKPGHQ